MPKSLVAFDTDQIKRYVFETRFLKEIRGASALLDRLNRVDLQAEIDRIAGITVYANGGGALAIVNQEDAEPLIHRVTQLYRQQTETASITGIDVPIEGPDEQFRSELSLLRYKLRMAKDGAYRHHAVDLPMTHSLLRFCQSCGYRHATTTIEDGTIVCHSCQQKRVYDRRVLLDIEQWASPKSSSDPKQLWPSLLKRLSAQGYPVKGYKRPDSFDSLAELSRPRGYMGLIYADGDGMGKLIDELNCQELGHFSTVVDQSVYTSVTEAIVKYLQPADGHPDHSQPDDQTEGKAASKKTWPFDILLLGGDDLVMVTQAQSAIPVALHVIEQFSKHTAREWGKPLKLSASVVIAHAKYPISSMINLAESGLKFAKNQGVQRSVAGEEIDSGLLNFLVVNNSNHLDFSEHYQTNLVTTSKGDIFYRTERPYTVEEMKTLLNKVQIARGLPRNKLEQLRAAVFKSKSQGSIDALKAVLRLRNSQQRRDLLRLVSDDPLEQVYIPWQKSAEDRWHTSILDIVELIDFMGDFADDFAGDSAAAIDSEVR